MMSQRVYIVSQQLIANNIDLITAKAWEGYRQEGRGAILIDGGTLENPTPTPMTYLSDRQVQETGSGWPSENVAGLVDKYLPEREIIVVVKWRGEVGVYRLKPPTAPPTAYKNHQEIMADGSQQASITLIDF